METPDTRATWGRFTRRRSAIRTAAYTKIIATIGPASEGLVGKLIDAGMDVARINFSHGTHEEHRRRIGIVRREAQLRGIEIGILADIAGPKLRLGELAKSPQRLNEDERVVIFEGPISDDPTRIPIANEGLVENVKKGHRILLADGACELIAEENAQGKSVVACVKSPGRIADRKGVSFPDSSINLEVPTDKDREDLVLANELGVDFCGISFVSGPEEVQAVRELCPEAWMVAKIERACAVENLDRIIEASDGIMVARGDLGVELDFERLPAIQKALLQAALSKGKFTITATEMLESMVVASRPTRAEVSDVAHAVLDGTDAVMLSAETAVGADPVAAVRVMNTVAASAESSQRDHELPRIGFRRTEASFANAVAVAAADAAEVLGVKLIVCFTETGRTTRLLSQHRPAAEVLALSPHSRTLRRASVLAHVRPIYFPRVDALEDMLERASEELLQVGKVVVGDTVVFVAGVPPGVASSTNVLKLHRIGDPIKLA